MPPRSLLGATCHNHVRIGDLGVPVPPERTLQFPMNSDRAHEAPTWSQSIDGAIARALPWAAAIRLPIGGWINGLYWQPDVILTASGPLPEAPGFTAMVAGTEVFAAQLAFRDAVTGVAVLRLTGIGPDPISCPAIRLRREPCCWCWTAATPRSAALPS